MSPMELVAGASWFILYAASVFAAIRLVPRQSPALLAVAAAFLYSAAAFPLAATLPLEGNFWRAMAVFCFLAICYLMLFGAVYKSVSLRMMLDLLHAPSYRLPADEVFSTYILGESFEARTQIMLEQGLATQSREGFSLTAKGGRVARLARALQRTFGIDTSG